MFENSSNSNCSDLNTDGNSGSTNQDGHVQIQTAVSVN